MRLYIIILLLLTNAVGTLAQQTHKEIKSISRSFYLEPGNKIDINGERTFINITTWEQNKIEATIEVIAKHDNQDQARNDLEKVKVYLEKNDNTITYSNCLLYTSPSPRDRG